MSEKPAIEEWREVVGFPDYAVSNWGRVKRVRPGRDGRASGRLLRPFNNCGYVRFNLFVEGRRAKRMAHVMVFEAFRGPMPEGREVNHDDGIKTNNWPGNLIAATPTQNMQHAFEVLKRRPSYGAAKLAPEQVADIRRRYAAGGCPFSQLAAERGVATSTIERAVNGTTYSTETMRALSKPAAMAK
jgi:hypothetical protein